MQKTIVLTPYYGRRIHKHMVCRAELDRKYARLELQDVPEITMARSKLASEVLRLTSPDVYDVVMWIDHDILFNTDDVRGLVHALRTSDYDMLGVLYSLRGSAAGIIGRPPPGVKTVDFYRESIVDADILGMGFTAVKRHVFDGLIKAGLEQVDCHIFNDGFPVWPFFSNMFFGGDGPRKAWLQEDCSFCRRVQAAGFKTGIYTLPRIHHLGEYAYALEDAVLSPVPMAETLTVNYTPADLRSAMADAAKE